MAPYLKKLGLFFVLTRVYSKLKKANMYNLQAIVDVAPWRDLSKVGFKVPS
jgi:hypothetical protein